jgi:hypothetical protein
LVALALRFGSRQVREGLRNSNNTTTNEPQKVSKKVLAGSSGQLEPHDAINDVGSMGRMLRINELHRPAGELRAVSTAFACVDGWEVLV